jgi:hypothetical protein
VIVDIGTGDGRAVLVRARRDPAALVIGIDAVAPPMAESSRRAERRGPRNTLFLAAGAETLASSPIAGRAHLVCATFPWGSLLRGILGLDEGALRGVAALLCPDGRLEAIASVVGSDRVAGIDRLDETQAAAIAGAWRAAGLVLGRMRPAEPREIAATGSSWARRLGRERPAWHLDGVRAG